MWICPKCNQKFVNRNQSHSCGPYTVAMFLEGKSEGGIALFRHFLAQYRTIGPFDLHPVKTRIALVAQMRFCAINKIGPDHLDVHLVMTELHESKCFRKIDNLEDRFFVHHLRIRDKGDITPEVRRFMRLAYKVGTHGRVKQKRRVDR